MTDLKWRITPPTHENEPIAILALDLATQTGWAYRRGDGAILTGTMRLLGDTHGERFLCLWDWLRAHGPNEPHEIVWEKKFIGSKAFNGQILGVGLAAIVQLFAELRGIAYRPIPVGTWRKLVGVKDKPSACELFRQRVGHDPTDDNEAEAYCMLMAAIAQQEQ